MAALAVSSCATANDYDNDAGSQAVFVYDDIDRFAAAMAAIDAGEAPIDAMRRYVEGGSPGLHFFAGRFGLTPEDMVLEITRRPLFYRYLTTLKPQIMAREPEFRRAIARLTTDAPEGSAPVPLYFMVGNQTAGGQPGFVETLGGMQYFVAIGIDVLAMSDAVDLSEFPNGAGGRQRLADIPQVVVHEISHVYQRQFQGLENNRSIYTAPERGTNLAYALREGCAEFLTERASGWVLEPRHSYVTAYERDLWRAFEPIMRDRQDGSLPWFGAASSQLPGWPSQVGYSLGERICRAYYDAAADKSAAMHAIYGAFLPDHFEAIVAPYAARMRE